ncbi:hypothetical protein [Dyadobacter diqingensis]|uniref:hypothetical protein n=1 Tax=Dyadobacter diqingensis TaxID=2938121 RepID=UPI0020C592E4|nr:hypothetical protein [Dyadobacter diqingensis]
MKLTDKKPSVMGLNNDAYLQYLVLRYVQNSDDPKWESLRWTSTEEISAETWIELHNTAKNDVENQGGTLKGYEFINNELVIHERINSNAWPANWMWVIES